MPVEPIISPQPVEMTAPGAVPPRRPKVDAIAFIAGVLVFAAGVLVYRSLTSSRSGETPVLPTAGLTLKTAGQSAPGARWEKQTSELNEITVEVTPLELSPGTAEWRFNVALDTHSVELAQDIAQIAVLLDGSGKEYQPLGWTGSPVGGHHRSGTLTFAAIEPTPASVQLELRDAVLGTRQFKWSLN